MPELLRWLTDVPALRRPVLLIALEGFVDAGAVAATAGTFLRHRWKSERAARFDRDSLLDYRARRPTAVVDSGRLRRIEWPDLDVFTATVDGPHDVALLLGPEPDMRWEAFSEALVAAARTLDVEWALTLGAYPAAAPHTRPVRVMKAGNALGDRILSDAGEISGYTGPVGAATVLQHALGQAGLPALGLWAEVPHYIAGSPNPPGALALVDAVARILGTGVDTTELQAAAKLHLEQVAGAVSEHDDAAEMIAALELLYDQGRRDEDLPSGDDLAEEIQRFLRSQG